MSWCKRTTRPDQKPWDGNLKYDYQLWIDSDIMFDTEKFYRLIHNAIPKEARTYEDVAQPVMGEDGKPKLDKEGKEITQVVGCLLYTSPSPRDQAKSRMPSSA